jgi:metal-dependent HD superfamily phosphatase/phosphodiesterase
MTYFEQVKQNEELRELIDASGRFLAAMDYTEHGLRHANYVSYTAGKILSELGYSDREVDLARIAGLLHDVGNVVNRHNHGCHSATLIYPILKAIGMPMQDITTILFAIGNHEEQIGTPVDPVSSALIIADKSDAHRTRVHRYKYNPGDIHDRVNISIKKNVVEVDREKRTISSKFYMDNRSSVMEFFEIYLSRIEMSERAAEKLNCEFNLYINDVLINSPKSISKKRLEGVNEISFIEK